jgi:hypothetical protein
MSNSHVAVLSLSLAFGRYEVWPSAEATVMVPGTSVVLSTIATPLVSIVTMGRLIAEGAGAKEALEMETVSQRVDVALAAPATATTVVWAVQLVCCDGPEAGKPSCPAETDALRFRLPVPPAVNVKGDTVMPEGKPVSVTLIGPV